MLYQAKQITLKNGKTATIKTPERGDGAAMLQLIKTACGETDFLTRYPEEWEGVTDESEENWIEAGRTAPHILRIACYIDDTIAGSCDITFRTDYKTRHRATIGITVLQKYWGLGIGSAFFEAMIDTAKRHRDTEIIELEFVEGNDRARALYEKFGFSIVGYRPNTFRLKDGRTVGEYFMQKELHEK